MTQISDTKQFKPYLIGLIAGVIAEIVLIALFAVIVYAAVLDGGIVTALSAIILLVSSFFAGLFSARIKGTKGAITGLITGAIMFILTMIVSAVSGSFTFSYMFFIKLLLALLGSATGGIVSVNKQNYKRIL